MPCYECETPSSLKIGWERPGKKAGYKDVLQFGFFGKVCTPVPGLSKRRSPISQHDCTHARLLERSPARVVTRPASWFAPVAEGPGRCCTEVRTGGDAIQEHRYRYRIQSAYINIMKARSGVKLSHRPALQRQHLSHRPALQQQHLLTTGGQRSSFGEGPPHRRRCCC